MGRADNQVLAPSPVGASNNPAVYFVHVLGKRISPTTRRPRGKRRRGRPSVHKDEWSKVSVVLFDRQIVRLDAAAKVIRKKTGNALTRAAMIRALIDGVLDGGLELTTITSESDLRHRLARLLR